MTSRERIKTTMKMGIPDRVPVWCLLSLEHIINRGMENSQSPRVIEELVEAETRLMKEYNFDGCLIYLPGSGKNSNIEEFIQKSIKELPVGVKTNDFETADPESWLAEIIEYEKDDFYSSHLAREIVGDDFHLGGWSGDGFSKAIQWFPTLEDAMMALLTDPFKFKKIIEYFDEQCIAWSRAQIQLGNLESIQISSPYAGSSFISLEMYKEMVLPSVTQLSKSIDEAGGISYIHTCGSIGDRLELLAESGTQGIECMDPPPIGNVSLSEAKIRVGDKIFLKGNIDSINILLQADDDTMKKNVIETINSGKPNGSYILSTACSVSPAVSKERVKALSNFADEFGIY
jgi:hypothetical protein